MKMGKPPEWICKDCATIRGGKMPDNHIASWHTAPCGMCGVVTFVTDPRDFGLFGIKKNE
jgi:hypothetical protein